MSQYDEHFMRCAIQMDALLQSSGSVATLANAIVKEKDETATRAFLNLISEHLASDTYSTQEKKIIRLTNEALLMCYGHQAVQNLCKSQKIASEDKRTLEELLAELNDLVGLSIVKQKVNDLIVYQRVQKMRQEHHLNVTKNTLHLAFTGNPGTGKTTVARIVGYLYKQLGLISKGHFIEASRTDLIAGYQGQTALKVKALIERAKGGVLFIDEAYSITENDHSDSYGRECLTELTKALEDYREDLVVIVAGYTTPMKCFFASNPGLQSRFNTFIEFDDYTVDELVIILEKMCKKNDYELTAGAKAVVRSFFQDEVEKKTKHFANGRLARNLYDQLVMNHARRVCALPTCTREALMCITADDFKL